MIDDELSSAMALDGSRAKPRSAISLSLTNANQTGTAVAMIAGRLVNDVCNWRARARNSDPYLG